jgi:hypothetical protein
MANTEQQAFIDSVLADAHAAASHLNIPVSVVLAQWANETGWGTSDAWRNGHNYAGVSFLEPFQEALGAHLGDQGEILFYPTRQAGLSGYIGRWADGVYDATRAAWGEHRGDALAVARDVEQSPWASGHYGGNGLEVLINEHNLRQYDGGPAPAPPTTEPQTPCAALTPGPPPQGYPLLRIGQHGPQVVDLQERLLHAGFPPQHSVRDDGSVDGVFGSGTAQTVADFQSAHGLHRDGIVGRQTWCALGVR